VRDQSERWQGKRNPGALRRRGRSRGIRAGLRALLLLAWAWPAVADNCGLLGGEYTQPTGASGIAAFVHSGANHGAASGCCGAPWLDAGSLVELAAGRGGGRLSIGLWFGGMSTSHVFPRAGFEIRTSLLRTWNVPRGVDAGVSYVGGELGLRASGIRLGTGVSWRVGGAAGPYRLWTWTIGFEGAALRW